ncbi:MAG TPA: cytochrome c peroxidase [Flavipsychrobacter sp.]|nr:cytochrome c peroxidase [Flavipsychrobacter sp.]
MKKVVAGTFILVLMKAVYLLGSAFHRSNQPLMREPWEEAYRSDCDSLLHEFTKWEQNIIKGSDIKKNKEHYRQCRTAYKKIAFLLGYAEPSIEKLLNGPNVPSAGYDVTSREVVQPHGFQKMEEMLFGKDRVKPYDLLKEINLTRGNLSSWLYLYNLRQQNISEWLAAIRNELVYVYTLSLAGFDNPQSHQSIPEAQTTLESLQRYFRLIAKTVKADDSSLKQLFEKNISYLKRHSDFNRFDRAHYYLESLQPLYARSIEWQREMGIPFHTESTPFFINAVNDTATNFFNPDFLNASYYSTQKLKSASVQEYTTLRQLGELLFYDTILSSNKKSCASCHQPNRAFAENIARSEGLNQSIRRNTPSLNYAAYQNKQFWDARVDKPELQAEHVILNKQEFNSSYQEVYKRIRSNHTYNRLFKTAYPQSEQPVNSLTIGTALAAYIRSLAYFSSVFDRYMRREVQQIDPDILKGYNLFMGKAKCGTCHFAPVFNGTVPPQYMDTETEVLGTTKNDNWLHPLLDDDNGRSTNTLLSIHDHSFKTPGLRNVAVTPPYMHHGAFSSLEKVVEFYNRGGGARLGLDVPNQTLPADSLRLTIREQKQLIVFMKALTDERYTNEDNLK